MWKESPTPLMMLTLSLNKSNYKYDEKRKSKCATKESIGSNKLLFEMFSDCNKGTIFDSKMCFKPTLTEARE